MKIKLISQASITGIDGVTRQGKPGDVVSVSHVNGRRLIYRRMAMWLEAESFDPLWDPPAIFKVVIPKHDKMIRNAPMNKGA